VAVETGQAVRAAIYNRVTADATMKSVFGQSGTVYMYRVMAPQDSAFPYIVDRLAMSSPLLHGTHTYFLDLWYYGQSPVTVDSAVDRLKILLGGAADGVEGWRITTGDSEIGGGIMHWFSGGYIPTDAENVWHYATQWSIRFGAARDISNIIG